MASSVSAKLVKSSILSLALASLVLLVPAQASADQLADIKKAGVLRAAVFDSNPPFG